MRFRCHRKRIDRFVSTLTFSCDLDCPQNGIELLVVTQVELFAHATITRACDIFRRSFHSIRFRPSTLIRYVCVFVLIHLVSQAFSNRCVFDENAQRVSADGRPKCVELYAH